MVRLTTNAVYDKLWNVLLDYVYHFYPSEMSWFLPDEPHWTHRDQLTCNRGLLGVENLLVT